jgi:hypothetical protein
VHVNTRGLEKDVVSDEGYAPEGLAIIVEPSAMIVLNFVLARSMLVFASMCKIRSNGRFEASRDGQAAGAFTISDAVIEKDSGRSWRGP